MPLDLSMTSSRENKATAGSRVMEQSKSHIVNRNENRKSEATEEKQQRQTRSRTVYSKKEVDILKDAFEKSAYPKEEEIDRLSKLIHHSKTQIKVWFQNWRSKKRRISNTRKRPGRPPRNAHPMSFEGEPMLPEEIMRRNVLEQARRSQIRSRQREDRRPIQQSPQHSPDVTPQSEHFNVNNLL